MAADATRDGPRRLGRSLAGLLATLLIVSCAPQGDDSRALPSLHDPIHFDAPLLLVPDLRWHEHPDGGKWQFLIETRFLCAVREHVAKPLIVRLRPGTQTLEHRYRVSWDGEELPPEVMTYGRRQFEIHLPSELLEPGRHVLRLVRTRRSKRCRGCQRHDSNFLRIAYAQGPHRVSLDLTELPRYHRIADFLYRGVVGGGPAGGAREHRAGVLFVGPVERVIPWTAPGAGSLRFEPENLTASPATFRLRVEGGQGDPSVGSLELDPGARGEIRVPITPGERLLKLEVEGEDEGLFLWGLPTLEGRPHRTATPIVLITLDTTRRDALGVYGGHPDVTPVLDAFARRATVFDRAYSTAPWTLPSHASIFTGLYPSRHGAGVSEDQLTPDMATLAKVLRRQGYLTGGLSAGGLTSYHYGLSLGFSHYRDPDQFETVGGKIAEYVDDFLDDYAHLPFFLFANYFDPHALYRAPRRFEERLGVPALRERLRGQPQWRRLAEGDHLVWKAVVDREVMPSAAGLEYIRAAYLAEVAYVDDLLGRLFATLERRGLFDRALILITADHGELLGEEGYFSHSARLDPELVEIPLLVKWPGQKRGHRVSTPVSLIDLYPTVLTAAGVVPPPSDGIALTQEGGDRQRSSLFFEEHEFRVHPLPEAMKIARHLYGVQKPGFRQIVWQDGSSCARRRDGVWTTASCTEDSRRLLEQIETLLQPRLGDRPDDVGVMSEEVRKSLEALGYL